MVIVQFILWLIGSYFLFYSLFWITLTLLSLGRKNADSEYINEQNPEILIILPAYKPGPIFFEVLDSVKAVSKGRDIQVYVLLQEAEYKYKKYAQDKGFFVEEKLFSHLGGNSYHHALQYVSKVILREQGSGRWSPEFVMLLDKDNLISKNFFNNIPESIYDRYDVIQGKRSPIRTNSAVAFFDGISECLNDSMFRIAKQNIHSMIEISGSGALIETDLFLDSVSSLDQNAPGFDKNFMVQMLTSKRDVRTTFWPASELKEEKTFDMESHSPQRLRWFGEQYYNALFHARSLFKAFRTYRRLAALDYLITLWRPPRSVQFLLTPVLAVAEIAWFFFLGYWPLVFPLFTIASVALITAVTIFLLANNVFLEAIAHGVKLPGLAMSNMFTAIRSIRKENRGTFIHTTHKL